MAPEDEEEIEQAPHVLQIIALGIFLAAAIMVYIVALIGIR